MGTVKKLNSKAYLKLEIDCYQLVQKVYRDLGREVPDFWQKGIPEKFHRVPLKSIKLYDLLIFRWPEYHVGICWKDNKFLQAARGYVCLSDLAIYRKWVEEVYRWRE